jgi:hypothetical protein
MVGFSPLMNRPLPMTFTSTGNAFRLIGLVPSRSRRQRSVLKDAIGGNQIRAASY